MQRYFVHFAQKDLGLHAVFLCLWAELSAIVLAVKKKKSAECGSIALA